MKYKAIALALGLFAVACAPAQQPKSGLRLISVTVHVRDDAGTAIDNAPLMLTARPSGTSGTTNAQGNVVIGADVDTSSPREFIQLGTVFEIMSEESLSKRPQGRAKVDRVRALRDTYAFPLQTCVPLQAEQSNYDVTIVAPRAVKVSATLQDSAGSSVYGSMWVLATQSWASGSETGSIVCGGVPKAESVAIACGHSGTGYVKIITVNTSTTEGTLSVDPIVLTSPERSIDLALQVDELAGFKRDTTLVDECVTLVTESGDEWYHFRLGSDGALVGTLAERRVPPGTYFVVPGPGMLARYPAAVRQLLKNGKAAELEAAGLPKVVAVAGGGPMSVVLHAEQARNVIATMASLPW